MARLIDLIKIKIGWKTCARQNTRAIPRRTRTAGRGERISLALAD